MKDNSIEKLLRKASLDARFYEEFCKEVLSTTLLVLTPNISAVTESRIAQVDEEIKIVSFPDGRIPIFSRIERIRDIGDTTDRVYFLKMKGRNLFELTLGNTLVLNPYSDYGKEFLPGEISNILKLNVIDKI